MPTYRVGVRLKAFDAGFSGVLRRAAGGVGRIGSAAQRAAGQGASAFRRVTGDAAAVGAAFEHAAGRATGALDRVAGRARQMGGAVRRASADGAQSVTRLIGRVRELGRAMRGAGGGAAGSSLGGHLLRAAGVGAAGAIAHNVATTDTRVRRLGVESGRSRGEQTAFRNEVFGVAANRGVSATEILAAAGAAQGKGGVRPGAA